MKQKNLTLLIETEKETEGEVEKEMEKGTVALHPTHQLFVTGYGTFQRLPLKDYNIYFTNTIHELAWSCST